MSIELVMPSNNLILYCLLLLPSIFPSIRVFSDESVLHIMWPNYWSFSFNISSSNEYSGLISFQFRSVQPLSCAQLFVTPWLQHARLPCPSPTPGVHANSCPSSRWYHPTISSSAVPFSSCPQSLPASESFPMSQLFTCGVQSIGVLGLASVPPKKSQDWSPSEWTGWIFLQSEELSRVFSNTIVQKHQFFSAQLSS